MVSQKYIEYHTLEFDFINSSCGKCEFGLKDNCQHYYGDGCVNND